MLEPIGAISGEPFAARSAREQGIHLWLERLITLFRKKIGNRKRPTPVAYSDLAYELGISYMQARRLVGRLVSKEVIEKFTSYKGKNGIYSQVRSTSYYRFTTKYLTGQIDIYS